MGCCLLLAAPAAFGQTLAADCGTSNGNYVRMSATANITFTGGNIADGTPLKTADNNYLIANGIARDVVRLFIAPSTVRTAGLANYDNYVSDAARVPGQLLIVLSGLTQWDAGSTYSDTAAYRSLVRQILHHYRAIAPNITYVEAVNEYDLLKPAVGDSAYYYIYYKLINQEVNHFNDSIPAGTTPLQVGGPCTSSWNSTKMRAFVNHFADDPDPRKKVDFFSYHEYNAWKTNAETNVNQLIKAGGRRDSLEAWLAARHLSTTSRPLFVTEEGIFPGTKLYDAGNPYNLASGSWLLMQAASACTYNYYFATKGHGRVKTFTWDTRIDSVEKSLLARYVPYGTNKPTPFGNTIIAMTLQGSNLLGSPAPLVDPATGFGLYELVTGDSNKITALLWNWQHINNTSATATLSFTNLPAAFSGHKVHMVQRTIDSLHSNYFHDSAHANLTITDSSNNFNTDSFTLTLPPNAVTLLTLTPGDTLALPDTLTVPDTLITPSRSPGFILFPNPAHGEAYVFTNILIHPHTNPLTLQLFTAEGQVLRQKQVQNNPERLDLRGYTPGLYFVRIIDGQGRGETHKLLIK
jgi:hypothetical protein